MTAGNASEPALAGLERAAAQTLGMAPGAPEPEVRAAFLRSLRDAQLVPGAAVRDAFDVLSGRAPAPGSALAEQVRDEQESQLRTAVELFAASFFKTAVFERRDRWQDLRHACADHPMLTTRLDALERGLDIEVKAIDGREPGVEPLARLACELFVLRPKPRAIRRQEWIVNLRACSPEAKAAWRSAAATLRRKHSKIAALAPQIVSPRILHPHEMTPLATHHARALALGSRPLRPGAFSPGWAVLLALIVATNVLRLLLGEASSTNRPVIEPAYAPPLMSFNGNLPQSPIARKRDDLAYRTLRDGLRSELVKLKVRPLDPVELDEIYSSVYSIRDTHVDRVNGRQYARRQLANELLTLGVGLNGARLDQLYDSYMEPIVEESRSTNPSVTWKDFGYANTHDERRRQALGRQLKTLGRDLDGRQLQGIISRVIAVRRLAATGVRHVTLGREQFGRELEALGVTLDEKRLDAEYDECFGGGTENLGPIDPRFMPKARPGAIEPGAPAAPRRDAP